MVRTARACPRKPVCRGGQQGGELRWHPAKGNRIAVAKPGREPDGRRFVSKFSQLRRHFHNRGSSRITNDRICGHFYDDLLDIHPVERGIDEKDDETDGGSGDHQKLKDEVSGNKACLQ